VFLLLTQRGTRQVSVTNGGGPRFAGVDWAKDDHAVCVVDELGRPVERVVVVHTAAGLARLVRVLARYGVAGVGIERGDGPVVDALLAAGLPVFVIAPGQVKSLRGRYGSAGNKDDRFDAFVLADTVRTDRLRLTRLLVDTDDTTVLRRLCRARKDLLKHRIAAANQLRAHLDSAAPGLVGLFSALDAPISLAFVAQFSSQDALDKLTEARLTGWLRRQRYTGRTSAAVLLERIRTAPAGPTGAYAAGLEAITQALVATLHTLVQQIAVLDKRIAAAFTAHPDAPIFTGLPKAGTLRAARLLAEIGDARGRFPTPASLACLAGAAPSTRQSGRSRIVTFRWGADKNLRDAVCDFAGDSFHTNPWANDLYTRARDRGADHPHAVRILARAWLNVIWKCWTTHTPYDPAKHGALQNILAQTG
jgi:transposase